MGRQGEERRELARLEAQLGALEEDIKAARALARRSAHGRLDFRPASEDARPRPHGERVALPDGAEVLVRPIEPDDAVELKHGFEHLSAVSRFQRFLEPVEHLTGKDVEYLTHVDHETHEALVAQDPKTGAGIASARYVRAAENPAEARVTFAVVDDWQHRGVGTALAQRLAPRARRAGIERLTAETVVGHVAARRLLAHLGEIQSERVDAGISHVVIAPRGE